MKTPSTTPLQARRGDPRGQVLVLFALMLVVLLLVSALAVDYGGWLVTKRNYQNSTDAAALAGAQQLTRPLTTACGNGLGSSKNYCAREASWESIKSALGLSALDPLSQATNSSGANSPYSENGYKVWVASPPSDAGNKYPGHVSGTGVVFVRVDHAAADYLSRIVNTNRTVSAWSTAGRFPANFAVIGMCSPTSITANCLAGDSNIKLDGTNTNLIVNTGDVGTNRWTKSGGSSSGVALGPDSNAYMQLFDSCWNAGGNQCNLFGYDGSNVDTSDIRAAIPLGAPIADPAYPLPPLGAGTPAQCGLTGSTSALPQDNQDVAKLEGSDWITAADVRPNATASVIDASGAPTKIKGTVYDSTGNPLSGATITILSGAGGPYASQTGGSYTFTDGTDTGGIFTIQASLANYGTQTISVTVTAHSTYSNADFNLAPNPGNITGTVRVGGVGTAGVVVSTNGGLTGTSVAGGGYSILNVPVGTWQVTATLSGYTASPNPASVTLTPGLTKTQDFTLTAFVGGVATGTVKDGATGLDLPGATVTASGGPGGTYIATTDSNGLYTISGMVAGTYSFVVSRTGYTATGSSSGNVTSGGTLTKNFDNSPTAGPWPSHCGTGGNKGSWSCAYGSESCPAVTNPTGANVSCTKFDDTNRIRPGTYDDIVIASGQCAWIDPTGGPTRLTDTSSCWSAPTGASCPQAGIVHVRNKIDLGAGSFLFGDGVTIVFDSGAQGLYHPGNGAGIVLNYGTQVIGGTCNLSTPKAYGDGSTPCFRTVSDGKDYAYGAWTTTGKNPWQCNPTSPPTYSTSCLTLGQEIGMTFYLRGSGLGNNSRFANAGQGLNYLFNGVLYGPNDDIVIGGGNDGQTAAGQIVGWTIEYHGGTRILQNWYGDPQDGQPFLIEPVLGE